MHSTAIGNHRSMSQVSVIRDLALLFFRLGTFDVQGAHRARLAGAPLSNA
jgi:hypothetical protein